ncbi:2,3-diketo-L-gulonate TRAP transporter small permease protein YiaM [Gimesia panareensis]|uniref:2,3-diketo-L-gulonate TRAP transporter small permease protein YiaM n=1 Tax=Gimesia panareensis TaxID=2527978 RepID=A0A517QC96_9PLAN|nr:TRAP transporter small permease [Gimesia panareensis]QDT29205.1 2,3-diketo-L-gulonate TRAP transporter small permease protein YiaM [Gimesia panareensis]QDV20002.1 2,3-diketo-L-gulonate TRAP transporter small permease protein YiaM [Gimesia panareensis]
MNRLFQIIQRIEAFLLAWSIITIAALSIGNVLCRALFGFSVALTGEVSQFLIIIVTFVGLSYAASRGRHIRMTAFYDQLNQRWRKIMMIIINSLTAMLMLLLAWYAFEYIGTVRFLETVSPVLQVPLYLVYLFVPLGFILSAIQYGLTVFRNLTAPDVYISYSEKDEYEKTVVGEV